MCGLECPHECVQGFSHCRVELKLGKRGVKLLAGGLWLHRFDEWAGISNPLVGSHLKQSSHLGCEAQYFEKLGLVGPCVLPGLHAQQQALMSVVMNDVRTRGGCSLRTCLGSRCW